MQPWRQRGYVSNSDQDEDGIELDADSQPSQSPHNVLLPRPQQSPHDELVISAPDSAAVGNSSGQDIRNGEQPQDVDGQDDTSLSEISNDDFIGDWSRKRAPSTFKTYSPPRKRPKIASVTQQAAIRAAQDLPFVNDPSLSDVDVSRGSERAKSSTQKSETPKNTASPSGLPLHDLGPQDAPIMSVQSSTSSVQITHKSLAEAVLIASSDSSSTLTSRSADIRVSRAPTPEAHDTPRASWLPARNFRLRKAIQLHPYMIEGQQYRNTMKSRGYRPVHLAPSTTGAGDTASLAPQVSADNDSDVASDPNTDSLASDSDILAPTSEEHGRALSAINRNRHSKDTSAPTPEIEDGAASDIDMHGEDELPDIDSVLRATKVPMRTNHRLHAHVPSNNSPAGQVHQHHARRVSEPPTPPTTLSSSERGGLQRPRVQKILRLPPGQSSRQTPVSVVSTSTIDEQRTRSELPSTNISERTAKTIAISSEESSSESDNDAEYARTGRLLRGVLPPSWLKLDSMAMKRRSVQKRDARATRVPTAGHSADRRGVARPVTSAQSPAQQRHAELAPVEISDDNSSDQAAQPVPTHQLRSPPSQSEICFPTDHVLTSIIESGYFSENMEDNRIDAMLAGGNSSRQPSGNRYGRKRQPKIITAFQRAEKGPRSPVAKRNFNHGTLKRPKPTAKSTRRSDMRLSIVDAPSFRIDQNEQPQFLRLAARQAQKQPHRGRHSPTQKYIHLATAHDTEEARSTLTEWRTGKLQPRQRNRQAEVVQVPTLPTDARCKDRAVKAVDVSRRHVQGPKPVRAWQRPGPVYRTGQLEGDASMRGDLLRNALRDHSRIQPGHAGSANPALAAHVDRFLQDLPDQSFEHFSTVPALTTTTRQSDQPAPTKVSRRLRKKPARRLDVAVREYRQPSEPLPPTSSTPQLLSPSSLENVSSLDGLKGLGSATTRYATDFDVHPLEIGTYCRQTSFIGSGDFDDIWLLRERNLDMPGGQIMVQLGNSTITLGAWNEDVADTLRQIQRTSEEAFQAISNNTDDVTITTGARATVLYLLRSFVRYCSRCLYFLDSVDSSACLREVSTFLDGYIELVEEQRGTLSAMSDPPWRFLHLDCLLYVMCLAMQMAMVAGREQSTLTTRDTFCSLLQRASRLAAMVALPSGRPTLRTFLEESRIHAERVVGISDDRVVVKWAIISHHLFEAQLAKPMRLGSLLLERYKPLLNKVHSTEGLDQIWYDVFTIQPLLEIDRRGIYRPGSRRNIDNEAWDVVKNLLEHTFMLCSGPDIANQTYMYKYIRAVISRAFYLVSRWRWQHCESVLNCIYDFFAKRQLANLPGESVRASPEYLNNLDHDPNLIVDEADAAFHLSLKVIVVGLRSTAETAPGNILRRTAWRLIPNHGRTYRKDENVKQSDLDALRNHHDLLSTFFWALPFGSRPRLEHIKNLVDFSVSHQEACIINIASWRQLAKLIMSHEDRRGEIGDLASWFDDIVSGVISQHDLARSEAEDLVELSRHNENAISFTLDTVQMTVSANQRRLLDTLLTTLNAMHDALKSCRSAPAAHELLRQSHLTSTLRIYDASQRRTFVPVIQTLRIIRHCLGMSPSRGDHTKSATEESQDYGDWEGLDDAVTMTSGVEVVSRDEDYLHGPVAQLVSNCFGSDSSTDDSLLAQLVEVWCLLVRRSVEAGDKTLEQYLGDQSSESWFQLRQTDHTQQWTSYVLAKMLEISPASFEALKFRYLGCWTVSLLGRESTLKFQHLLTSRLLDMGANAGLTHNLPFGVNPLTGRYVITLSDLRTRRVSLIGGILANMRRTLEQAESGLGELRVEFARILRQAMASMRQSYQELSTTSSSIADKDAQGNHVGFVQQIISLMQQYTSEICQIDSFFTDSAAFPLPREDPAYVVGRLKAYAPRLGNAKGRKQLVMFMLTLSQRAKTADEQDALLSQLTEALMPLSDHNSAVRSIGLRDLFLAAIVPAVLEVVGTDPRGQMYALTMLKACGGIIGDIRFAIALGTDDADVESIRRILVSASTFLRVRPLGRQATVTRGLLDVVKAVLLMVKHAAVAVDYKYRASHGGKNLVELLLRIQKLADGILACPSAVEENVGDDWSCTDHSTDLATRDGSELQATFEFARKEFMEMVGRQRLSGASEEMEATAADKEETMREVSSFGDAINVLFGRYGEGLHALHGEELGLDELYV